MEGRETAPFSTREDPYCTDATEVDGAAAHVLHGFLGWCAAAFDTRVAFGAPFDDGLVNESSQSTSKPSNSSYVASASA